MRDFIYAEHIQKSFQQKKVLDDLTIEIKRGEFVGLSGQSGCGKTTLAKILVGLMNPDGGRYYINGEVAVKPPFGFQMVFQNYRKSLTPHMTIYDLLWETLKYAGKADPSDFDARILEMAQLCALNQKDLKSLPSQLSGGQAQRAVIARTLISRPEFVVFDEPVSALDICLSLKILDLIQAIRKEFPFSCLFITHDNQLGFSICDRVLSMEAGRISDKKPALT